VKETRLEPEFSRYETYEEKMREVYRPKGLLAFAAAAKRIREATLTASPLYFHVKKRRLKLY
jgi:hypothetical protein